MSPTATLAVGLKHVGVKIDEQTRSLEHLGNNINSGTHHHRPYSRAELARGMLDKATCGQGPSVQQALDHIFELTGRNEDRRYGSDITQRAMDLLRKREMVDSLQFLPEYLQCLRNAGWHTQIFTSTADEMAGSVGRILHREWADRCKKNNDLQPMALQEVVKLLDFGDSKFCTGWLASPPNHAPTHLVPGLNEEDRPGVRLVDACHMKAPGNEGTLYSAYRPDANRSYDAMAFVFQADVENSAGWQLTKAAMHAHEPPMRKGGQEFISPPPGHHGDAVQCTTAVVGDGDKGIAEAFEGVIRCCFHRQQNFAVAFPKKLAQKDIYAKVHRAASLHKFKFHFKHLTPEMQRWTKKLPLAAWAQHAHKKRLYGHFNGPETMNNKPLMPARNAPNMLATLKEIVHMVSRRDRGLALQAASWVEPFPPRVMDQVAKAAAYDAAMPQGSIAWLDNNLRRNGRVAHPSGHTTTCKLTLVSSERATIDCDCGFVEREGWCWCAYMLCTRGNTVAWQHIIPVCLRTPSWRGSHPSSPAWLPPTPEEIATVDASAIRAEAGLASGEALLSPVAVPRPAGRPKKEYYIRYDHAATRAKKAKNPTTAVDTAGLTTKKNQRRCELCGGYGHTKATCAKYGFVIATLGPLEQAQSAAALAARPPLIDSWPARVAEGKKEPKPKAELAAAEEAAMEVATFHAHLAALGFDDVPNGRALANAWAAIDIEDPDIEGKRVAHDYLHAYIEGLCALGLEPGAEAEAEAGAEAEAEAAEAPQAEAAEAAATEAAQTQAAKAAEVAEVTEAAEAAEAAQAEAAEAAEAEAAAAAAEAQHPPTWSRGPLSPELVQFFEEACVGPHDKQQGAVQHSSSGEWISFCTADLRTLRPKQWLSNWTINNFFHLVVAVHTRWPGLPRTRILKDIDVSRYFLDPCFKPLGDMKKWFLRDRALFDVEMVFIPFHLPNHWTMAVLNIEGRRIDYYDSMRPKKGLAARVMAKIQEWAVAECHAAHRKHTPTAQALLADGLGNWPCNVVAMHNQQDWHSCGVYVCQTALMLALGNDPIACNMTDTDATALRPMIGLSLLGNQVAFPNEQQ